MLGALGMTLREEISAPHLQGHFYGCTPRHHSLAAFGDRQLHLEHVMVEMNELDDVGRAMDRCEVLGPKLLHPLGRHPPGPVLSLDRKRVVSGKRGSVRLDSGSPRMMKKKKEH